MIIEKITDCRIKNHDHSKGGCIFLSYEEEDGLDNNAYQDALDEMMSPYPIIAGHEKAIEIALREMIRQKFLNEYELNLQKKYDDKEPVYVEHNRIPYIKKSVFYQETSKMHEKILELKEALDAK